MTNHTHQQGFTLVETLVSLLLLTAALIPTILLTSSSARLASTVEQNLVATNLAREGIEVVHAIRDSNWFAGNGFADGLSDGDYAVEWDSTAPLSAYTGRYLRIDDNGRYTYDGTAPTQTLFLRKVTIQQVSASELKVTCIVSWQDRTGAKEVSIEDHLFDWK